MASVRWLSMCVVVALCTVLQDRERGIGRDCEVRGVYTREIGTGGPLGSRPLDGEA
jgi:hypothetical protein